MKNFKTYERFEKKLFVEKFSITSPHYLEDEKTLLILSDIHYHKNVDLKIYEILIKKIFEIKPSYVIIPGDIIETMDFLNQKNEREFLENIIKSIAQICPIIIILGNHDIGDFSSVSKRIKKGNIHNEDTSNNIIKYFESWNRFNNVYFLNNNQITIGNTNFLGFNPEISTYYKVNDQKTNEIFIENYLKSNLKANENEYNILLVHSPLLLFEDKVKKAIPDLNYMDLVISGHMHDGYLPKCLDKYFVNSNTGIFITPFVSPYPGLICRGMHEYGRGFVLVSQGFRKYTNDNIVFNFLENFTANDIETISLKNGIKSKVKKL